MLPSRLFPSLGLLVACCCGGADQEPPALRPPPAATAPPAAAADASTAPAPLPPAVVETAPDGDLAEPPPSAGPIEPSVTAERLEVAGPLPEPVIARILRQHRAEVRYCYEQALQADPALAGRVVLRFTIGADGNVSAAEIASSTVGPAAGDCLIRAMRRWRFPQPRGAQPVRVTVPVVLAVPAGVPPDAPAGTIDWTLTVQPARVTMAHLRDVTIHISARNRGGTTVDPGRHPLEFTIDGERSMALDMGFGNGAMERAWTQLPPGQTVHDERVGFEELVSAPGRHVIVVAKGGTELARAVLDVRR